MNPNDLKVRIEDPSVAELLDWASLWGDLLHVDMVLLAREGIDVAAPNLFIRRALWESAVISYGRTATSGRRQSQIEELLTLLSPDERSFHQEVMAWRNQHVAHRVDLSREQAEAIAIIHPEAPSIKAIQIRVNPVLGPEDEDDDLANRFKKYIEVLRNLAWTQKMAPLEQKAIEENSANVGNLITEGLAPAETDDRGFYIDIDPTGGSNEAR
jgi:hypothetical protein